MTLRKAAVWRAGLALVVLLVPVSALAQATPQAVFVSAVDDGRPVLDLEAFEFRVREEGESREVLSVNRAQVPVQVAVLVDDSYGVTSNLGHLRRGLEELIDSLPDAQMSTVVAFGDQLRTLIDFTRDKNELKRVVGEFAQFSETSWYLPNALAETAIDMWDRGAVRPIIVLVTSEGTAATMARIRRFRQGDAVVSPRGGQGMAYDRVLEILRDTKVAVHTLVVRGAGMASLADGLGGDPGTRGLSQDTAGDRDRASLLAELPRVTGGGREELGATSALAELLNRIGDEISNQYFVVYARPAVLVPPEQIEVSVTRRGVSVRSTPAHPILLQPPQQ
ncbi:MAG: hypothetical protein CL483_14835 [Acidobacteria bacterium]|jgi:VWFA-related protein|nr:hypothetical protein [Acidobacteriota bacterium]